MVVLFQWFFAHLLGDFVLQSSKMVQHKKRLKAGSWILYVHCLIHGALVYLFAPLWSQWYVGAIVAVTHFAIDLWKLYRPEKGLYFIIDQALHVLVLLALWIILVADADWWPYTFLSILRNPNVWVLASGTLLVTFPMALVLGFATQRWRRQAEEGGVRAANSLSDAGRWIGIFERILVFTFVCTGHFEGIGFLIAAKSILRFNDIKGQDARKESEYILIGTLMSFASAILIGLLTRQFLID